MNKTFSHSEKFLFQSGGVVLVDNSDFYDIDSQINLNRLQIKPQLGTYSNQMIIGTIMRMGFVSIRHDGGYQFPQTTIPL